MTKLYYTIEKQTEPLEDTEVCTGWKNIQVYEIANDQPKLWFELEVENEESSLKSIQSWLDNSGFRHRKYEFVCL